MVSFLCPTRLPDASRCEVGVNHRRVQHGTREDRTPGKKGNRTGNMTGNIAAKGGEVGRSRRPRPFLFQAVPTPPLASATGDRVG